MEALGPDMLVEIMSFLRPGQELAAVDRTCKTWHDLLRRFGFITVWHGNNHYYRIQKRPTELRAISPT